MAKANVATVASESDTAAQAILDELERKTDRDMRQHFLGPKSNFILGLGSRELGHEIVNRLPLISKAVHQWNRFSSLAMEDRWRLIEQLAAVWAGATYDLAAVQNALNSLNKTTADAMEKWGEPAPKSTEPTSYAPSESELGVLHDLIKNHLKGLFKKSAKGDKWTQSHWQIIDFLAPVKSKLDLALAREKVPILLANKSDGRVVTLVVESASGPNGMVYPDWWRLQLFPFGGSNKFVAAVQTGLCKVTQHFKETRLRLRWWLELDKLVEPLLPTEEVDEGDSVQAAAACLALALYSGESKIDQPILDDTVGLSAIIGKPIGGAKGAKLPDGYGLKEVDHFKIKRKAAEKAGVVSVVFSSEQEQAKNYKPEKEGEIPVLQFVDTLAEAYDSLLITSKAVAAYKQKICEEWEAEWAPTATPN